MSAALQRFSQLYPFKRFASQKIAHGMMGDPIEVLDTGNVPFTMMAVIQRLKEFEATLLPEGLRNRASIKIWTTTQLNIPNEKTGGMADRVFWKGSNYDVLTVDNWTDGPLEHLRYLAFKVETR